MDEYTKRYDERTALMICCAHLDVPYYGSLYQSIVNNNSFFNVGLYLRQLQMQQYQYQTFLNSIVTGELGKCDKEIKEEIESKWNVSDKRNMKFALSIAGYDPFDGCGMSDNDRRYCFNILAGYCNSSGINEDGHKIQSVIQMTQLQLQCKKLDEFINMELLSTNPDDNRIKQLSSTKKQLLDGIAQIAKDNNLASAYNKNSDSGANTLTKKMKELEDDDYQAIKVNLFDIQTCGAVKQIADLSTRSILDQLALTEDEKSKMIADQKDSIDNLYTSISNIEEENRMLKNKILDLENKKKK